MGVLKCNPKDMTREWLSIVISFLEKYYTMLQFGGRNPKFGVNHVFWCFMYLDVYYFCVPGLISLSIMM